MDNETTLHYAALVSQLTIHAKRVVRELDPSQELEQLRKEKKDFRYSIFLIICPRSSFIQA